MLGNNDFVNNDLPFSSFSQDHFGAVLVFFFCLIFFVVAGRCLSHHKNLLLTRVTSVFLSFTVIAWTLVHASYGRFDPSVNLPLSICNLFALIAPLLFWHPNERRFEVIYFFILSGTLQAIVTPDPSSGFPSYSFFKYWITHCGLVVIVVHHHLAFRLYPRPKGILRTFGWLNIYILCLLPFNIWLEGNYFYMMQKPAHPTLLDYFGPWPIYIIVTEALAMLFFALAYIPIIFTRKYYLNMDTIGSLKNRDPSCE